MSRRHAEETQFGSDSFLDIVANIVGILIILIVVAGVRVSQAPLLSIDKTDEVSSQPEKLLTVGDFVEDPPIAALLAEEPEHQQLEIGIKETTEAKLALEADSFTPEPTFAPPSPAQLPELPTVHLNEETVASHEKLLARKVTLAKEIETEQNLVHQAEGQLSATVLVSRQTASERGKLQALLARQQQELQGFQAENTSSQSIVRQLRDQLTQTLDDELPATTFTHRLNPVGRIVNGREVHFRILDGEVAYLPIDSLTALVRKDMQRRKDYLLKQSRFQSVVGPANGFEMEYLVQRADESIFDGFGYGNGMVKVYVSDWEIRDTAHVDSETVNEALKPGSQFRSALISGGTNATITFWTYSDSFEAHQQLKEFVHEAGLWVASRPLPIGVPIAGSAEHGSKSIAQ